MIPLQGRYAWVEHQGKSRLLHVLREEREDFKTSASGGWITFIQTQVSEASIAFHGYRLPPKGVVSELESQGIPYQFDEELAIVRIRVADFQRFMMPLVLDDASITEEERSRLLLEPDSVQPTVKTTKAKKHPDYPKQLSPTLLEKPIPFPNFAVHPGASVEQWGPMMQTGMVAESFRSLVFSVCDCEVEDDLVEAYSVLSVLHCDTAFFVTNRYGWPKTKCRIVIAGKPMKDSFLKQRGYWELPAKSPFLIVDNYQFRGVRQIALLELTATQVPFFRSGFASQTSKLVKKIRGNFHQTIGKNESHFAGPASSAFSSKPRILPPFGDWQNNPAVVAWLNDVCS